MTTAECPVCKHMVKVFEGRLCHHGWIGHPDMCSGSGKESE